MKIHKIKEEHFNAPLTLITDCAQGEFLEYLDNCEINVELDFKESRAGTSIKYGDYSIVWIDKDVDGINFIEILTHELLHYCLDTMHQRGVPVNWEGQESIAYFQQKMIRRCLKEVLKELKFKN